MAIEKRLVFASLILPLGLAACGDAGMGEDVDSVELAQEECVVEPPSITEVREENPGAVAAGVTKIYHVTVQSLNDAACGPASISFVPDAFMLFSIVPQPSTVGGVGPNGFANFRVEVSSDPSQVEGVFDLGFTLVSSSAAGPTTTARGSLPYEIDFDNPTGCNRQRPQIEIAANSPPPVPAGTAQTYAVTVRNVDNPACGPDTFSVIPDAFQFFSIVSNGPFSIPAQGSAVFDVTATSDPSVLPGIYDLGFTVVGNRHGALTNRAALRYQVQ